MPTLRINLELKITSPFVLILIIMIIFSEQFVIVFTSSLLLVSKKVLYLGV